MLGVRAQGGGEGPGAVAGPAIGEHGLDCDPVAGEERGGPGPEASGGFLLLVREDFRAGQPGVVIDSVVQVRIPGSDPAVPPDLGSAQGAVPAAVLGCGRAF